MWNVKEDEIGKTHIAEGVLIETLWNVKKEAGQTTEASQAGINRNIVECKERCNQSQKQSHKFVLIETLWNVKWLLWTL